MDMSFNPLFFRWMLGEDRYLSFKDIKQLDPVRAKSFNSLMHILNERDCTSMDSTLTSVIREEMLRGLSAEVEEQYLDFSLPGSLVIELKTTEPQNPCLSVI
jgi:E3 ubiquitin-protein ligase TRIP12